MSPKFFGGIGKAKKEDMSTPPPPKPWETTTMAAPATSKDTPLAPGDAMKPWDVPGAGEVPSGEKNRELFNSFF